MRKPISRNASARGLLHARGTVSRSWANREANAAGTRLLIAKLLAAAPRAVERAIRPDAGRD
jgi:hypothetical protein